MAKIHVPHHHTTEKEIEHLYVHLSQIDNFETVTDVFKQLSDSTRLRIFWMLCHCEECVADIAAMLEMSSPAVSHHLKVLKDCKLISATRSGKEVYYKASESKQSQLMHQIIEQVMEITCVKEIFKIDPAESVSDDFQNDQVYTIHKVHDYLTEHISERITIDELSKKFLMNSTTLKSMFKDIYGDSIASHIKAHRMSKAAVLLTTTDLSLLEIANQVGYESQSKFSSSFKETYNMLPSDYRRENH